MPSRQGIQNDAKELKLQEAQCRVWRRACVPGSTCAPRDLWITAEYMIAGGSGCRRKRMIRKAGEPGSLLTPALPRDLVLEPSRCNCVMNSVRDERESKYIRSVVLMYVRVCICRYTQIKEYVRINNTHIHLRVCVCLCVCAYTCMPVRMCVWVCLRVRYSTQIS